MYFPVFKLYLICENDKALCNKECFASWENNIRDLTSTLETGIIMLKNTEL